MSTAINVELLGEGRAHCKKVQVQSPTFLYSLLNEIELLLHSEV